MTAGDAAAPGDPAARPIAIGEAADRLGLSPRALRYYEQVGLVMPSARTTGGNRLYSAEDLERVRRIRSMQDLLGADLDAIRAILMVEDRAAELRAEYLAIADGDVNRQRLLLEAHDLYEGLLTQIDTKLERLHEFRAQFAARLARGDARLAEAEATPHT
ncbi:MAG: MerR family transcriptional regulator, repressor of the yfmOP operon [Frankiaceae bacterium]|nr:MerR family transcriptional regulator, repressor of the yfmOP operon [Frankiaceae bacterium]